MASGAAVRPESIADPSLFALVQTLADNKYWLGKRYAEWCTAAPTLESAVAAAAMAQDEIGHARSLYPLFRGFTGHDTEPEDRAQFHSLLALEQPFAGWTDFVATNFLVDTALTTVFEAGKDATHDDFRNRCRRIAGEEHIHWLHARGWVRRLASQAPASREALSTALQSQWSEVIQWFGPSGDPVISDLRDRDLLDGDSSQLRDRFVEQVTGALTETGLPVPDEEASWEQWDSNLRKRRRK
jgi:phenylacetate-CoA oxygenase PaaI subunit